MKTILHITECLGSGVLYYVKNLCSWQIKDFRVVVAYSTRPETPENFKDQFDDSVEFIKVDGFTREISPLNDLQAFHNIRKIVRCVQPDLIHLHSTKAGVLGRWAINNNRYKILYSPHAYSFLMEDCDNLHRKFYESVEKMSNRKNVITVTDIDGELEASRKVTRNAICIPNGISCAEMDEIICQAMDLIKQGKVKKNYEKTVCMIGKAVPQKNPQLFNMIAEQMKDIHFIWIGAGPLEYELKSSNIEITGWVSRAEAIAKIIVCDMLLFTSKWESLSIALLEAMYVGKMCIVSNADGNKDVIKDGINGYVCYKLEDYLKHISYAYTNTDLIESMGSNSREAVIKRYNLDVMERKYKEYFVDWKLL